jgi:hypothetical protein
MKQEKLINTKQEKLIITKQFLKKIRTVFMGFVV